MHETDLSLTSPRPEVSVYEDGESSLPLESSFVDDMPYIDLEEVPDPLLTSSSLFAPSSTSTPISTNINALALHASTLPLAQCTRLEMGELYRGDVLDDDFPTWSKERILVESHLEEAPFEELCDDSLVVGAVPNIDHIDPICTKPLDSTPTSSPLLPANPSPCHAFHESLGNISGFHSSVDAYCTYLEDVPRKIM